MSTDADGKVIDLGARRRHAYEQMIAKKTGLTVLQLCDLAITAERQGATPHEVRAILDGDMSWLDRARQK